MRILMLGYDEQDERIQSLGQAGIAVDAVDLLPDADAEAWQTAGRTSYDMVWVKWAEADHSVRPLVGFRALRPATRIVVEVPDEISPPNAEISQWVSLGVYDIVRGSSDTTLVIQNAATIADALSWTGLQPVDNESEPAKPLQPVKFRTVEVEKRVAVSARPVLIAVVGTSPGVGTTTTAVAIAKLLASMNHEVALAEVGNAPPALERWEEELPKGITAFPSPAPDPLELVRRREWAYVVVDSGAIGEWSAIASWQADLTVLCGPGDHHRFGRWHTLAMSVPDGVIAVGAVIGGGKNAPQVVDGLSKEAGLTAFAIPATDTKHRKSDGVWLDLLAPVIPDIRPRRRWWTQKSRPLSEDRPEPVTDKPDPEWKYTPSQVAPAPYYAPPPPQTLNLQVSRPSASSWSQMKRLFVDGIVIWLGASAGSWFVLLWNGNTVGTMPGIGGKLALWASWVIHFDVSIFRRL